MRAGCTSQRTARVIQLKQLLVLTALAQSRARDRLPELDRKERADRKRKDLTVEVMANSPARRLLERLDFKAVPTQGRTKAAPTQVLTVTMRY